MGHDGRVQRSRGWLPPVIGLVAFMLTVVALGTVIADWALRNAEMDAFITAVESSEAEMTWTQDNVRATFDAAGEPTSPADKAQLAADLQAIAAEGRDRIATAGQAVAAAQVSPWHQDLLQAKQAYLTHNKAWQSYLDRASQDAAEFGKPQDEVDSTFMAAEPLFRAAIPRPNGYAIADRVEVIFAEPTPQGPTQDARLAA
jgi:hypothetical protein